MKNISTRKWFYPVVYTLLVVISMLPPITDIPYDPRNTQDVIQQILMVSIAPYRAWGWVFHLLTLGLVALGAFRYKPAGRLMAAYFGFNYLLIAGLQTNTTTERYGFALQTGALVGSALLGIIWLVVAWRGTLQVSFHQVPRWRWLLLPFALLVFWSPLAYQADTVLFNPDPLLLLTSPDFGLTYCFMTPVLLFLLTLFYPGVDRFAFRVTAFNGLIYGLLNLTHWFNPNLVMMGVMHIPLLVLSVTALILSRAPSVKILQTPTN